jgi:hypothetical protein
MDKIIKIEINKQMSFSENWFEGAVTHNGTEHKFWLIHPQGVDPNGYEYEVEVRWFFQRVPREVRAMVPQIIESFKQKI